MKKLIDLFRAPKKLSDGSPNWNEFSSNRILNQDKQKMILEEEARLLALNNLEPIPTYKDYYEPPTQEEIISALEHFAENQQDYPEEFKKTFKKRFKDILA